MIAKQPIVMNGFNIPNKYLKVLYLSISRHLFASYSDRQMQKWTLCYSQSCIV